MEDHLVAIDDSHLTRIERDNRTSHNIEATISKILGAISPGWKVDLAVVVKCAVHVCLKNGEGVVLTAKEGFGE